MNQNKRPQKRWETEEQIINRIDSIKADQSRLMKESIAAEKEANALFALAESRRTLEKHPEGLRQEGKKRLEESGELASRSARREAMAKTMGEKLSAFRTIPMEVVCKGDYSVV